MNPSDPPKSKAIGVLVLILALALVVLGYALREPTEPSKRNASQQIEGEMVSSVLAAGRVVDGRGQAVVGAQVFLEIAESPEGKDSSWMRWQRKGSWFAISEEDGGFSIPGSAPSGEYRVTGDQASFLRSEAKVTLGDTGVVLRMHKAWQIQGRVLVGEDGKGQQLMVGAIPKVEHDRIAIPEWVFLEGDGSFLLQEVPDGKFLLRVGDMDRPALYQQEIALGPEGGETLLADIDLRKELRRVQIHVLNAKGETARFATVTRLDGTFLGSAIFGPASFLTTEAPLDVYVSAENCHRKRLQDVQGEQTVQLEPGIPIRLNFPNFPNFPPLPKNWILLATLASLMPDGTPNRQGASLFFYESEKIIGRLPQAGKYRLFLEPVDIQNMNGGIARLTIPGMEEGATTFLVADQEEVQDLGYDLSPEQIKFLNQYFKN